MSNISVIVPVYNVEPYLRRCVDSILAQTFADFEVILVDDGSPDNCGAICDEYAAKDSRVTVIHKENGGLSSARNAGLDVARGKYVYFVDGDDAILPHLIETVLSELENGADMVSFSLFIIRNNNERRTINYNNGAVFDLNKSNRLDFILNTLLNCKIGWEAWSRAFRRDLIEENGLRFVDNSLIFAEDLCFTLCYCLFAKKIVALPDCLYEYTENSDSIMSNNKTIPNFYRMNELSKAVLNFFSEAEVDKEICEHFPVIHHLLFMNEFKRIRLPILGTPPRELRSIVLDRMTDVKYFQKMYKSFFKDSMNPIIPKTRNDEELLNRLKYISDGHYRLYRIRRKLIRVKYRLKKWK